ncbi:MAG: PorT family protein [Tannerella sp.]|nr:PorT family protein [Tannerella sp.]
MKRFILILCTCSIALSSIQAQKQRPKNQPYADMKRYHLGFHIGLHTQDLILAHSGAVTPEGEVWFAEIPGYAPGLSVGVIGDLCINPYINLRFTPTVHFGNRDFTFIEQNTQEKFLTSVRSNYISFPLDIKYSSFRLNNFRPYMLGGVFAAFDVGRKKSNPLLLNGMDYGVEVGMGCDMYLPYFKFCPEIKFCFGLANVLHKDRSDLIHEADRKYTQALSRAMSRMIVLTFNFE